MAAINPGAPEVCNGLDDNCDGFTDEGLADCDGVVEVVTGQITRGQGTIGAADFNWSSLASSPSSVRENK